MNMANKYEFFNIEKIVQLFYYIQKNSGADSKLELIKFIFFADRIHIRKHFSLISLDNYVALKYGPVASGSLNVLNKQVVIGDFFRNPDVNDSPFIQKYFGTDPLYEDEEYLREAKEFFLQSFGQYAG